MLQTLNDKLKELLDTLKGTNKPFVDVKDYHTLDNTGYPYASFENISFEAEILDNCNNVRTYTFELLIFQEITKSGGRKEAKEILYKCMDDVFNLIDKNYTLGLTVVKLANPIGGTIEPLTIQNGKCLVARLLIEIQTYNSITQ